MEAAAGSSHSADRSSAACRLRLRHAPVADPVDAVVDTFLSAGGEPARDEGHACLDACTCDAPTDFTPLRLRCPKAASVVIGVESSGRLCLEVQVGSGAGVGQVLAELEEAERWLRDSAHTTATVSFVGKVDMSRPVRRRVEGAGAVTLHRGTLERAGIEVKTPAASH